MSTTDHLRTNTISPWRAVASWAARIMLLLLGVAGVYASIFFSFFVSPADGGVSTAFDWFIAAWALLIGLGAIALSVLLGRRSPTVQTAAVWLVLAHVVFGLIKLIGYQEGTAVGFLAFDGVLLALLWVARRPRA